MRKTIITLSVLLTSIVAVADEVLTVSVTNPSRAPRTSVAVDIPLESSVASALVTDASGSELPCQLDDLDGDGRYDRLAFMVPLIGKRQTSKFTVTLSATGQPREYVPLVYADMMLTNKKIKSQNKQDLYISSLTVDNGTNPYWMLHHHGPAFENELVAYRIYFDERQTVDIYGKYRRGLELRDTQFYPDSDQKSRGYGDDILWVGSTFGLGALRGWADGKPQMLQDVAHRTLSVVSRGPVRTVVKVEDKGWNPLYPSKCAISDRLTLTTYYILYANRRDCIVDVRLSCYADASHLQSLRLSTGLVNVKNSVEYSDHKGLRGCWGTDWPVSAKDSVGHKRETVGLGICLPKTVIESEQPVDKDNYPFVLAPKTDHFRYHITFASDNETFEGSCHSADAFFSYLREWESEIAEPCRISCSRR